MAKHIRISKDEYDDIRERFELALSNGRFQDGKFKFEATVGSTKDEATIRFSEIAWHKMQSLIRENDKEVGWYCLAERFGDLDNHEYLISDILVYPQVVTSATVDQDERCPEWVDTFPVEVKQQMRGHGHSHVNMGTSPSSTDRDFYSEILDQLTNEMFYIFMIWNKKQESTCWIYDMKKNLLFEDKDISIVVNDDGLGFEKFLTEAAGMIKAYVPPKKKENPYSKGSFYSGNSYKEGAGGRVEGFNGKKYDSLDEYYQDLYGDYYDPSWRDM